MIKVVNGMLESEDEEREDHREILVMLVQKNRKKKLLKIKSVFRRIILDNF